MTSRQELIKQVGIRWRVWKRERRTVIDDFGGVRPARIEDVLEAITDECLVCKPGTLGAAMLAYYRGCTQRALARLDAAVERAGGERE